MSNNQMQVYPCSYSRDAALINQLMRSDPWILLIDTRRTPRSQMPAWREPGLVHPLSRPADASCRVTK